jgi:hypothetical protein
VTPPPAIAIPIEDDPVSDVLLAQVLDKLGTVLSKVGNIEARLDHGQKQFDALRNESTVLREMVAPVVTTVTAWTVHVEAAKDTTTKFTAMEPEFKKMKTVTARFLTVAMVQGSVVGAALWGLTLIWPVVWGWIKTHVSLNLGG